MKSDESTTACTEDDRDQERNYRRDYDQLIAYVRAKINQLLTVMGTLPLRTEELDDQSLLSFDPIGVIAQSFQQVLDHHREINRKLELANNEIETILDTVGLSIIVLDRELNIEMANQMAADMLVEKNLPMEGQHLYQVLPCCQEGCEDELIQQVLATGRRKTRHDMVLCDRTYDLFVTPLNGRDGGVEKIIMAFVDTRERRKMESQLRLAAAVFDNTMDAIVVTDEQNNIIAANNALLKITGYCIEEVINNNPAMFKSNRHDEGFYQDMWQRIKDQGYWKGEIWDQRKNGEVFPSWQSISVIRRSDGSIANYISIISDITLQKQSQEQLDFLAHHDSLTDLPNRVLFNERLRHAIDKAKRNQLSLGIVFIDLDRFKNINDTLGHAIGDKLLIRVAAHMKAHARQVDTVARMGGDEFIILLDEINDANDIAHFATKLINSFHDPFVIDGYELFLTLSMGICVCPGDGDDVETLVKNADAAMYRAKEEGRNGYRFFTEELSRQVSEKLTLENNLRQAISLQQFELYFQPQYRLIDKRLLSTEVLLRWNHPRLGQVSPDRFIPLAEETGLIIPLGEWVVREACKYLRQWRDMGHDIAYVAINVSGLQIQRGNIVETLLAAVKHYDLQPGDVEIEITESIIMEDTETAVAVLKDCKARGFSVAIDDFGTGYSSLGYLKKLPVDRLKIDRSFIQDLDTDADDEAIVRAIIALAKNLQLSVVAEGIESQRQYEILLAHGCEIAQGYYLSRPLSRMQFEAVLRLEKSANSV